jgi:hypothetical protein
MTGSMLEISFKTKKGEDKKVVVPPNKIFVEPEPTDDPFIFWIWERRLKPAFIIRSKDSNHSANVLVMNLHSLSGMEDCSEDIVGCTHYLSAVMVEELSHCASHSLKNHKQWIKMLKTLQEELYKDDE